MSEFTDIYTEKIHHISCERCEIEANTMDESHELTKKQAIKSFKRDGWVYEKGKGWLCLVCQKVEI